MILLLQLFCLMGGLSVGSMGLSSGPIDLSTDWQAIDLRAPLTAQTGNPRLILYLRDLADLGIRRERMADDLPRVLPPGSIEAVAYTRNGARFPFVHTGYSFFRGMPGLVLERDDVPRGTTFYRLEVRSQRSLSNTMMIWLDSLGAARPDW